MTHQTFSLNTAVIFLLITFLHAIRLLRGRQVTIKGAVVPIWISWIALAIAAYLAYEGFRLAKPRRSSSESVQRGIFLQATNGPPLCRKRKMRVTGLQCATRVGRDNWVS
jgi:hypothetical protein